MSTWAIVLVVVAAWIVVSIVVALVVARAIKIRDEKERGSELCAGLRARRRAFARPRNGRLSASYTVER
ncbi:hypothetical protein [Gordonia sp. ABSL49_1]|uniref:hypothetical protein n=1 Tax=Gordonia sp. ABSL49_1 TaxID=2920941 RepID=UPI001F0CEEC9|nr:hypothetical protein [Gordonia sp. ABSL49_1]MCH5643975.1 hypothetical protein [Gordonia sp. ABSL49_1]